MISKCDVLRPENMISFVSWERGNGETLLVDCQLPVPFTRLRSTVQLQPDQPACLRRSAYCYMEDSGLIRSKLPSLIRLEWEILGSA